MDSHQFREFGKSALDFLGDYYDNIRERPVLPAVDPGYLRPLVPDSIPQEPESWQEIMKDMNRVIMPGMTHWASPHFHGYCPVGTSFPSIIGEMLCAGLAVVGFTWSLGPACAELEMVVMDWLAKAMDLPPNLLNSSDSDGGGCIQSSASEATLVGLIVAKEKTMKRVQKLHPELSEQDVKARLVCYASDQSNSSVEKAGLLASVPMRILKTDENGCLRGKEVEEAIKADLQEGLIPCYLVATFGTTPTCAFDKLEEIGPICERYNIWLHLDAAYAGAALLCPELRYLMPGIHHVDSIVVNLHKWFMVNLDCSAMWVKNCRDITDVFGTVERPYLLYKSHTDAPDLKNWQIPLGRRFRALKVWFTLRTYGLTGLQQNIRNHVILAKQFEQHILADPRFEMATPTSLGVVCFKAKGDAALSTAILAEINRRNKVYLIPGKLFDTINIRFIVTSPMSTSEDMKICAQEVIAAADTVMSQTNGFSGSNNSVTLNKKGFIDNHIMSKTNCFCDNENPVQPTTKGLKNKDDHIMTMLNSFSDSDDHLRSMMNSFNDNENHPLSEVNGFSGRGNHLMSNLIGSNNSDNHVTSKIKGFNESDNHLMSMMKGFSNSDCTVMSDTNSFSDSDSDNTTASHAYISRDSDSDCSC